MAPSALTPDERLALDHFNTQHSHLSDGRFVVLLPKKPGAQLLGESRSQALRRFIAFEQSSIQRDTLVNSKQSLIISSGTCRTSTQI